MRSESFVVVEHQGCNLPERRRHSSRSDGFDPGDVALVGSDLPRHRLERQPFLLPQLPDQVAEVGPARLLLMFISDESGRFGSENYRTPGIMSSVGFFRTSRSRS